MSFRHWKRLSQLLVVSSASLLVLFLTPSTRAIAQSQNTAKPAVHAFEVVSIRPNRSGNGDMIWAPTPDGYRAHGQSIWQTILIAYYPQGPAYWHDRIQGAPSWIGDLYEINARVSEANLPEWQRQGTSLDKVPMLREMLQSMLGDRCKLIFHRIPSSVEGYALVANKHGAHLAPSRPGATLPDGMKLPDGGVIVGATHRESPKVRLYNVTMADFLQELNRLSYNRLVLDRTGLTDRYDIVLPAIVHPEHPELAGSSHYGLEDGWDIYSLGVHLVPIKLPVDNLVIDHIEKPSEN